MREKMAVKFSSVTLCVIALTCGCVLTSQAQTVSSPTIVIGQMAYQNYLIPKYFQSNPTVELICVSRSLRSRSSSFVPKSGQILGRLVSPLEPSPFKFEISLPIAPTGDYIDLDNNGKQDSGVQVFAAMISLNLFGDSYLEQLEQGSGYSSILTAPGTGAIQQGTLLLYAHDNRQKAPTGPGKDGRLFTDDDPIAPVRAGYSLMRIALDGRVSYERKEFRMDLLEPVSAESPDFSKQGILESYNSLIDLLEERYAYTELRKIDWKQMREKFLARAKAADTSNDLAGYYILLQNLANAIRDGHVAVSAPYTLRGIYIASLGKLWSGNLGAKVTRLTDGRFIVFAIGKDSPAEKAGFQFGTEILSINGKTVPQHLAEIPVLGFPGTAERAEAIALPFVFFFPQSEVVEVSYRQPGEADTRKAKLTAEKCDSGPSYIYPANTKHPFLYEFLADGDIGYVQWLSFDSIAFNIAGWEKFLEASVNRPGIIIDLRGNGGGLMSLMYTMASYLFPAEKAVSLRWLDIYDFDSKTKTFVKAPDDSDVRIHSPRPELSYTGNVVVLVNGGSASAAEFFAQFLQKMGRATVIAEEGTDGAGGTKRQVSMPGKIQFTYTGGQMFFAGTREVNLEGKGVPPDIRVPITEENERRKLRGEDVVLSTAIDYLRARFPKTPSEKQ
jgi:C-terminal processing protease CtpA/Prc